MPNRLAMALAAALAALAAAARPAPAAGEFVRWRRDGGVRSGVVPSPVDRSHLRAAYDREDAARRRLRGGEDEIPAAWDSRTHGWVGPVRDQGDYGACWTFSALACLEIALQKAGRGAWDLSENHMANHDVGFACDFDDGGNSDMSTALLTSWRDPVLEADDPYPAPGVAVDAATVLHVQRVVTVPGRTNAADNARIKRAVMEYGAVGASIAWYSTYLKQKTGGYYLPYDYYYANHAVTIVGWDDAYPAANFRYAPDGPGAFLIRNSWGEDPRMTTNGYNWVSYYDVTLGYEDNTACPAPEDTNNYARVYQYDPCGAVEFWNSLLPEDPAGAVKANWCANMYVSDATGTVSAVGFYSAEPGTVYTLRVYTGCDGGDPSSGVLACETSGTVDFAGYTTVPLPTPAPIAYVSERFSVVLHVECPVYGYPMAAECGLEGYCNATAGPGESFVSGDGEDWADMQPYDPTLNFCLKAYTLFGAEGRPAPVPLSPASPASDFYTDFALWLYRNGITNILTEQAVAAAAQTVPAGGRMTALDYYTAFGPHYADAPVAELSLRADIAMDRDGAPHVGPVPDLGDGRAYRLYARRELEERPAGMTGWGCDVTGYSPERLRDEGFRFFKIAVEMPR